MLPCVGGTRAICAFLRPADRDPCGRQRRTGSAGATRDCAREPISGPGLVGHGGTLGLMQIKLATARGLGYTGTADGLLDPNTNLTYAVKYLAGAYRTAGGNADRAVGYYASGYYYAAKRQQLSPRATKTNPQAQNGNGEPPATAPIAVRSTRTTPAEERVGAR